MELLALAASLANLVCFILVLVKLFPDKGTAWGIFGIICGIYTFIWGWQNAERFDLQKVMLIWTICLVLSIFLQLISSAAGS